MKESKKINKKKQKWLVNKQFTAGCTVHTLHTLWLIYELRT